MAIQPDIPRFYTRLSNTELLDILENPGSFQAEAIKAAKAELFNRQLSEEEISNAKDNLQENQSLTEMRDQKEKDFKEGIDKKGNSLIASFNPNQKGISKNEKSIRIILIALGVLFLYESLKDFTMIQIVIKEIASMPFEAIVVILPIVILPLALFLFWKRSAAGWRLLTVWLTFFIVRNMNMLLSSFTPGSLSYLFPAPSFHGILIQLIILCGTMYTICQNDFREEFKIDKNDMLSTLALTALLSIFFFWMIY